MSPIELEVKVFISYARADRELCKKLQEHLSPLVHSKKISIWHDQEIPPGADWENHINARLGEANMILLLVSSSFIASKYCWNKEVQKALKQHEERLVQVIPVILRPALWEDTPLGRLQVLPEGAKPVTEWDNQDAAFNNVVRGIQRVVQEMLSKRAVSTEDPNRYGGYTKYQSRKPVDDPYGAYYRPADPTVHHDEAENEEDLYNVRMPRSVRRYTEQPVHYDIVDTDDLYKDRMPSSVSAGAFIQRRASRRYPRAVVQINPPRSTFEEGVKIRAILISLGVLLLIVFILFFFVFRW